MSTVAFITRSMAGTTQHGNFPEGTPARIDAAHAKDISLNLSPADAESYARRGNDLHITLANGQELVLENYYSFNATGGKNLFLSQEGEFIEVVLEDKSSGMLFATYEPLELSGKWSAYDEMVFLDVDRIEPVVAPLAAPLFGGLGAAGAAAGVVGAAVLAGGGSSGGGGIVPTVDDPDASYPVSSSTTAPVEITGTGAPDSEVTVTIGTSTGTATVTEDGTWSVAFPVNELPEDGDYPSVVRVVDPDGNEFDLDGPSVVIDTIPPEAEITSGAVSTGDTVNAEEQADGPVITGTGEPGATVTLEIDGANQTATVAEDGTWSVTFAPSEIREGEYETAIAITTTDDFGNSTAYTDMLAVDTIAPPVTLDTVEGDDVINAAEASDGVVLSGTGEAGASIEVEFQGMTRSTTVAGDGTWSVPFVPAGMAARGEEMIAPGEYDSEVTITSADAHGNTTVMTSTVRVDTTVNTGLDRGQAGGDDIVNAAEALAGITLTGTADAGASVAVTFQGITRNTTARADGTWSVDYAASEIAAGEYDAPVTVTATDASGNTDTVNGTLRVDTGTQVAIDAGQAGGDDTVNHAEAAAGLTLTGTGEPGASVSVAVEGVTRTATVAADGTWAAEFEAGALPPGEYDTTVSVTSTDAAGNTATATADLHVDTLVDPLTLASGGFGVDNTVNAAERSGGVTLTGTVEPGSTVVVQLGTAQATATVDADGNWSADFAASEIPAGSYDAEVVVTATDAAGNTDTIRDTLAVDTEVAPFTADSRQTADDVVNLAERNAGLSMAGTVEPGSDVTVTIQGAARTATVDANGNWSADFEAGDLRLGTYEATAEITATDAAGNTLTLEETFSVDTEYDAPNIGKVISPGTATSGFFSNDFEAGDTVHELTGSGSVKAVTGTKTGLAGGRVLFEFDQDVPDGSQLVVNRVDDAGNSSGTLVVFDDGAGASVLDHSGLQQFNIGELNLDHADGTDLTLSEANINALSGNDNTLVVHGGADDRLTITGAQATGTKNVDGETYNVYTIGDDGTTLVIDGDITSVVI